jgi:DNA ligase (NAD+)
MDAPCRRLIMPGISFFLLLLATPADSCPQLSVGAAKQRLTELTAQVDHHNRLYYEKLQPAISDAQYDRLFAELLRLEECFPALARADSPTRGVGFAGEGRAKVAHQRPMLSLDSTAGPEAVEALLRRLDKRGGGSDLLLQPKIDGLPVELVYVKGRLVSAATRGDGIKGEEVTARVRQIKEIPLALAGAYPAKVVVRGEVYADRQVLATSLPGSRSEAYASERHLAAATLRAQSPDAHALAALRFFTFEWVNSDLKTVHSDHQALRRLASWGLPVATEYSQPAQTMAQVRESYQRYLAERQSLPFATDGLVVKVNDLRLRGQLGEGNRAPLWAAAWKFPPVTARSQVLAIQWRVGRTGRRTPVATVEPVLLAGVRVSRVSLHSAAEVARLGISAGDPVIIALAGDAVPQVLQVIGKEPQAAVLLSAPPPPVDACLTPEEGCREQFLARAVHFASPAGLDIAGLGRGRLQKLLDAGLLTDLPSLFHLQVQDIISIPGFGARSAEQLVEAVASARQPSLPRLISALGIPGVGPATVRALTAQFPDLETLVQAEESELVMGAGVSAGTAANIRAFIRSAKTEQLLRVFQDQKARRP